QLRVDDARPEADDRDRSEDIRPDGREVVAGEVEGEGVRHRQVLLRAQRRQCQTGEREQSGQGHDEGGDADDGEEPSLHGSDDEPEQQHDYQRDQWRNALPDYEHPEQRGRQSAQLRQGQIDLAEEQDEGDAQSEDREERDRGGGAGGVGRGEGIAAGGLEDGGGYGSGTE